jgi:hypothetical protein
MLGYLSYATTAREMGTGFSEGQTDHKFKPGNSVAIIQNEEKKTPFAVKFPH